MIKQALLLLWTLPQNLLGLLVFLAVENGGATSVATCGVTITWWKHGANYYRFYTERWADRLGGVNREDFHEI